jgi:heme oxygenase (mycobilin-producing)
MRSTVDAAGNRLRLRVTSAACRPTLIYFASRRRPRRNMSIISVLELRVKPDELATAPAILHDTLLATRAFAGCLGVEVVVDVADPAHFVVLERWESLEADTAYRNWRASSEGGSNLGTILAGPPTLTKFEADPAI